jgi:hypothetical protein
MKNRCDDCDKEQSNRFDYNHLILLISALILLIVSILLSGCTTTEDGLPIFSTVPLESTNRASMPFTVDGTQYIGAASLQRKSSQTILFTLPKETAKLMITTCNREEFVAYPPSDKPFSFYYLPVMYIENLDSCLLIATAITKKGESFKAILDFSAGETLPATLKCNGKVSKILGSGICQSRAGLIQALDFESEVIFVAQEDCPEPERYFGVNGWQFRAGKGFCAYLFEDKQGRQLRFTTYGYTQIDEIKIGDQ